MSTPKIKYITKQVTLTGAIAANNIADIITENLPSEYKRVAGIAFFENANANNYDYELRVADSTETHQDFTSKYDYLSVINGVAKNTSFVENYKSYDMKSNSNKLRIGIKNIDAVAAAQTIKLTVVIKLVND